MLRRLIWLVLALAVAGSLAWALWPRPLRVEAAVIGARDIVVEVEETGRTRIRDVFTVSAPTAGSMARLNLHAGDEVVAGQTVVARISPAAPALLDARTRRIAEASRDAAEATVALAQAELDRAEAQADYAGSELERSGTLLDRGAIPASAMEQARLDASVARAGVESARANLLVAQRQLESAQAALIEGTTGETNGDCCIEILAPSSGRILRVLTQSEQVVAPGTPLLEIGDPLDIEVEVELLSSDAVRVAEGARAVIEGWGGSALAAYVIRIDPSAVTKVSALGIEEQRVTAILALDDDPADWSGLGDGYSVTARIAVWEGRELLAAPIGALFRSGQDWAVFRIDEESRARLTPIRIGERNDDWAELREGLREGDVVVLHPSDLVTDGVAVTAR